MATVAQVSPNLGQLQAYMALDGIYGGFERAALELSAARAAPLCVENCGRCCEINTPYCWGIEASYIISALLGQSKLGWALDACRSWLLDRVDGLSVYGPREPTAAQDRMKLIEENQVAAKSPCPFLDAEKRCAIHEFRPLVCRAYGVTRLPSPFDCKAPLGLYETKEQRLRYGSAGAMALQQQVSQFLRDLPPEQRAAYFLPTALLRQARPKVFAGLQDRFASAKMVAFATSPAMIWQEQLEQQWRQMGVR